MAWDGKQAIGTGFDGTCRRDSQPQQVKAAEIYLQEHTRRPFLDELEDAEGTQYLYSSRLFLSQYVSVYVLLSDDV